MDTSEAPEAHYLSAIVDILPEQIYYMNMRGEIVDCNEQQAKVFGLSTKEELIGKNIYDVAKMLGWEKSIPDKIHGNTMRVIKNKKAIIEEEMIVIEQKKRFFLVRKNPLFNNKKEIIGVIGISIDITDRKETELLKQQKEIAEKNSEVMNLLSGSVAHEVRTPLAIIQINADLINLSPFVVNSPPSVEKKEFLDKLNNIHQALKECSQVMNMLLVKIKKLMAVDNKGDFVENCSINEIIETALKEYPFRENEKKIVRCQLELDKDFHFQGNSRFIKHVLFNLLKNALYAIDEAKKGKIFIETKIDKTSNYLIFRDTGCGIAPDYLPKIFNKFETTDEAHSGTGLGLAFCKYVVESYGGKIECRSKLGKFTEFVLSFPLCGAS